jgi:hypothetical protein
MMSLQILTLENFPPGKRSSIIQRQMGQENSSFFASHNAGDIVQEIYHFPA